MVSERLFVIDEDGAPNQRDRLIFYRYDVAVRREDRKGLFVKKIDTKLFEGTNYNILTFNPSKPSDALIPS